MWLVFCLISTIISGFICIAIKKCSDNDPKRVTFTNLLYYHAMMIVVCIVGNKELVSSLNVVDMMKMLPGVFIQSIGCFCAIASIKYGLVSITSSIKKTKVVVTFLLGVFILQEHCTLIQLILSAILVFLSIILAKNKEGEQEATKEKKQDEKKAIWFSYGFVLLNGTSNFLNKVYVGYFQDPMYVLLNYAILAIIGVLIYCLVTKKWDYINIKKIKAKRFFLLQSFLDMASSVFDRFALLTGDVSVISVINTSAIAITVLASCIILKEKITKKQIILIIGVMLCVFLLALIK